MKKIVLLYLLVLGVLSSLHAQQKPLTYDDIKLGKLSARSVGGLRSMKDGEHFTTRVGSAILRNSYRTGQVVDTIVDMSKVEPKLNFSGDDFTSKEDKILFTTNVKSIYRHSFTADYWVYDIESGSLKKLSENGPQQVASISPDGEKAAFVRDNNIFWCDLSTGKETQITFDGKFNYVLNGIPDWVYEEEFGFSRAFEWSPASDAIAYYRTDEERVKSYHMNMFNNELYPTVYTFKYPKAGEQNSVVTIHIHNIIDGGNVKVDIGDPEDQYISRIKWVKGTDKLAVFRLNRLQNTFDMLVADASSGKSFVAYNETNPRYVERIDDGVVTFLDDDKYILRSEKNGYTHLYLYSIKSGELNPITQGEWDVTSFYGVDYKGRKIYYSSCEGSPLRRNLYEIGIDGKGKKRLTDMEGTNSTAFSNGMKYYINFFSNIQTPTLVTLHSSDGKLVRVLEDNADLNERVKEYVMPQKEFIEFTTSEGVKLNGYMVKPVDFDPSKKYPVFMTQYSGPGSQSVADRWGMGWEYALLDDGYIIACVDGRGTGFRGEDFKKCTYKDLGHYETLDQIEAARYFGSLPFVDSSRIGIYGWSYGGFMALNCILKGNDVFKAAIAVAPVTNWRYYDTIYTEVYNGLPQDNQSGYDNNSPINFADRLKGKLLIAHGTGDDNVHIQNTYEMINALTKNGKDFEMCIYPDKNHGMGSSHGHIINKCIDFIKKNL